MSRVRYHTRTQQRPAARAVNAMDRDNMPWTRSVHELWEKVDNANKARERLAEASIIQQTWPTKVPGELELKYLLSALDECDRKFESARTSHVFNRRLFYRRLRNEPHDYYGAPQLCECTLCNRTFSRHQYAQHERGGDHQWVLT